MDQADNKQDMLPILPLRDIVVFPHMIVPLFVGREKSVKALDEVMQSGRQIVLLTQRDSACDDPTQDDLYSIGTIGNVLQLLKLPDGTIKVLVEGCARLQTTEIQQLNDCLWADYKILPEEAESQREIAAVAKNVLKQFDAYVKLNRKIPQEVLAAVGSVEDMSKLADTIASHLDLKIENKQRLLGVPGVIGRLEQLYGLMEEEMELLQVEKRIRGRVKKQMEKSQREYYLGEQMKAIQKELGEEEELTELEELEATVEAAGMSAEAFAKAESELKKLKKMPPMSSEATVVRNYIDWLVSIPWKKRTRVRRDLAAAAEVLDADHFGLEKVKERIVEYLAVLHLVRKMKGPILCFVGPPGVGKTSLGKSIAKATNRKFIRMSLGGVRDEAEIRGHRRTYIGSLPGKVIQSMKKAGAKNPLFLLDEIDKMGADFRGDPSSALLEVLDPEQNHAFNDHYLEVDYDLSEVMFITTANSLNIPSALLDRMEVIRIHGYTEDEKLVIARRHLLPEKFLSHGLTDKKLKIGKPAILDIIRYYTREAGVRNLDRELAKICRKAAKEVVLSGKKNKLVSVQARDLEHYLGVRPYRFGLTEKENKVGVVTGLAWTEVGGELLQIETAIMPGKGKLTITGQIGQVMQESVQAALTYVRSRADLLGLKQDFHQKIDLHVHVPEGSIPKDGPSAGLAMATSITSALTGIAVKRDVCMTGEITLRGKALPIGGLKEKLLAARRGGLAAVLIPEENAKDLKEIPDNVIKGLQIHTMSDMDDVLEHALHQVPAGLRATPGVVSQVIANIRCNEDGIRAH
ncbi:MAG: endopeptidase La [Mariprofundaceae bacterium]